MNTEKKDKSFNWRIIALTGELGYTMVIPLIALALAGRLLDKKLATQPAFFLIGIFTSLIITSVALYYKVKKIFREMDNKQ